MTNGVGKVSRMKGKESITIIRPRDTILYKKNMSRVDSGYQQIVLGAGFLMYHNLKSGTRNHFWVLLILVSTKLNWKKHYKVGFWNLL